MDILFWSGGKDAYLALEFYRQNHPANEIKLLTTYEEESDRVPHQNIPVDDIKKQAEALELGLILLPLPEKCPNDRYLENVNDALDAQQKEVENLVFGDWYLQDIREWREQQFANIGYKCCFPIWERELNELLPVLLLKGIDVRISAVKDEFKNYIRVGESYNQKFVRQLPKNIDPMGEKGEFHTKVIFKKMEEQKPGDQPLY